MCVMKIKKVRRNKKTWLASQVATTFPTLRKVMCHSKNGDSNSLHSFKLWHPVLKQNDNIVRFYKWLNLYLFSSVLWQESHPSCDATPRGPPPQQRKHEEPGLYSRHQVGNMSRPYGRFHSGERHLKTIFSNGIAEAIPVTCVHTFLHVVNGIERRSLNSLL